ncbi:hypothetical protein DMC01_10235 [Campylobacter troglodytis]|nr:hypothetical protein DMC01_10235 [Campylobacter troglodytis]
MPKERSKRDGMQAKKSSKKTFWPYGILLSILAIVGACIATIIFSLDYPVYEDDAFLQKYREVNSNFNELQIQNENFQKAYELSLDLPVKFGRKKRQFYEISQAQRLEFKLLQKTQLEARDLKITVLLTRPHTSTQDQWLENTNLEAQDLNTSILSLVLPELERGRWQLKLRLERDENTVGFYEFEFLVGE